MTIHIITEKIGTITDKHRVKHCNTEQSSLDWYRIVQTSIYKYREVQRSTEKIGEVERSREK